MSNMPNLLHNLNILTPWLFLRTNRSPSGVEKVHGIIHFCQEPWTLLGVIRTESLCCCKMLHSFIVFMENFAYLPALVARVWALSDPASYLSSKIKTTLVASQHSEQKSIMNISLSFDIQLKADFFCVGSCVRRTIINTSLLVVEDVSAVNSVITISEYDIF
jgi:hypothetical protein